LFEGHELFIKDYLKFHIDLVESGIKTGPNIRIFNHADYDHHFYGGDCSRGEVSTQCDHLILHHCGGREMGMDL